MPYQNVPDELQDKMESCVMQVMDKDATLEKENAIAICYSAVVEGKADAIEAVKAAGFVLDTDALKAGRRHSDNDMRELAQIVESAIKLGAEHPRIVRDIAQPANIKAAELETVETFTLSMFTEIKAAGDWELDVLGVPLGGPKHGKDAHGEYFSERTKTYAENFSNPLVCYYHGFTPDGRPQGEPEIIGKVTRIWNDIKGWWYRVVLDRANEYAKRIWQSAQSGNARASSGSIAHLVRRTKDGEILTWPVAELSLIDADGKRQPANAYAVALPVMKALYEKNNMVIPGDLPDNITAPDKLTAGKAGEVNAANNSQGVKMENEDLKAAVAAEVARQRAEEETARTEAAKREAEINAEVERRVEAAKRRLPSAAPYVAKFGEAWKFDNVETGDLALGIEILNGAAAANPRKVSPASKSMYATLAMRAMDGKGQAENSMKSALFNAGLPALKSDEVMQQDLTSYGDEWVGVGYGTTLWEKIRQPAGGVLAKVPQQEIPQGVETFYDPTEGTDPTWYKVPEVTSEDATMKIPAATVPSSKAGTGRSNETLAKIGCRVQWSGELNEDSLIPMLPEIRRKIVLSGQEQLENILINGDTETGASTNINDIAGTPAGTETFMTVNGFRKLALVTNTANSRSAAGGFTAEDFLKTVKLMGLGGQYAVDRSKVSFVIDLATHWAAKELDEVKTRDVFAQPTLEGGMLSGIWGYEVMPSAFMHFANQDATYGLKANSAGKLDLDTAANNLYGAILAVRWDRWKFGWKRRMTIETERVARADYYEIVALARFGLKYFDTEAAAITYYVGV